MRVPSDIDELEPASNGPSIEWLIRNRIIRAKDQLDAYSELLAMVEREEMPTDVEDMLIKLLSAI